MADGQNNDAKICPESRIPAEDLGLNKLLKKENKQDWSYLDRGQFIALVVDRTCNCDMMNGYDCGHTRIFDELQKRIPK